MSVKNWKEFNEGYNLDDPEYSTEDWPTSKSNIINSEAEFRGYAKKLLMNAHGDGYDQNVADETIKGLLDEYGDDFGAAVGALQQGLAD